MRKKVVILLLSTTILASSCTIPSFNWEETSSTWAIEITNTWAKDSIDLLLEEVRMAELKVETIDSIRNEIKEIVKRWQNEIKDLTKDVNLKRMNWDDYKIVMANLRAHYIKYDDLLKSATADWVTLEVLKSIRDNSYYSVEMNAKQDISNYNSFSNAYKDISLKLKNTKLELHVMKDGKDVKVEDSSLEKFQFMITPLSFWNYSLYEGNEFTFIENTPAEYNMNSSGAVEVNNNDAMISEWTGANMK